MVQILDTLLTAAGDPARAERDGRMLHASVVADLGEDTAAVAEIERVIVLAVLLQGRAAEARALGAQMFEKAKRTMAPDDPRIYRAAATAGAAVSAAGDRLAALGFLSEAVAEAEARLPPGTPALWELRLTQARVALDAGQPGLAAATLRVALPALERQTGEAVLPMLRATALGLMAQALAQTDPPAAPAAFAAAVAALERAVAGIKAPAMVPLRLTLVADWGEALIALGRREEAAALIAPELAAVEAHYGADSAYWADLAFVLAVAIAGDSDQDPDLAPAERLMARVVTIRAALQGPGTVDLARARVNHAVLLAALGRGAEAVAVLRDAGEGDVEAGSRGQVTYALHRAEQAGAISRDQAIDAMLGWMQVTQRAGAAGAQRALAARLAAGGGEAGALLRARTDAGAQADALRGELALRLQAPLAERDGEAVASLRAALARASDAVAVAEAALAARRPDLADLTGVRPLSLAEIRAALPAEGALVVIDPPAGPQDSGLVVAVSRERAEWHSFQVDGDAVEAAVRRLRGQIGLRLGVRGAAPLAGQGKVADGGGAGDPAAAGFDLAAAHWLHAQTLGQVEGVLAGKAHLFVDLRGSLAALPPQLMLTAPPRPGAPLSQAPWLVRRHAVTILPAIAALGAGAGAPRPPPGLMAFADPLFGPAEAQPAALRGALAPLPETEGEVRAVARALGAGAEGLFLRDGASEAAVKAAALDRVGLVYFATHGLVSGDVVAGTELGEPALALTAGGGEDGFLLASEIAALRLDAEAVVLSACNTALGDRPDAEALSGLAQAFLYAGARSLLVSHWPVDSRAAVALMSATFAERGTAPGLSLAEAQRRAMLAMIERPGDPRWSHPAYWAPFVQVGGR